VVLTLFQVVLLPTELLADSEGVHFSPIHWTTKAGKAEGRVLGDTSNGEKGAHLLNGNGKEGKKYIRERMIKRWGAIKHPTLEDLVRVGRDRVVEDGLSSSVQLDELQPEVGSAVDLRAV
jgi:hypothetical protein